MFRSPSSTLVVCALIALFVSFTGAFAQDVPSTFVYINDDVAGANTVSAFKVNAGGALTPVTVLPFSTGGSGTAGGPFMAATRIVTAGRFLYASNAGSGTISGFSINSSTGVLTPVPGSPFPTGVGSFGQGTTMSLAATPNGAFLMAGYSSYSGITAFSINPATGALTILPGSPVQAGGPAEGMKVSPDGKYLAAALPLNNAMSMMTIASNGVLTPVSGSPFNNGTSGTNVASVDFNCPSTLLFSGNASSSSATVSVFGIGASGALSHIQGSPFNGTGGSSIAAILDPKDKRVFLSNRFNDAVSVFDVAAGGSLSEIAGSPFRVFGGGTATGMATTRRGDFLFVTNKNKLLSDMAISLAGSLSPVSGSPYLSGNPDAAAQSVAVYPPKRCSVD